MWLECTPKTVALSLVVRQKYIMKNIAVIICILILQHSVVAQSLLDLTTHLMRSTYKLEGGGSVGTAFVLLDPIPESTNSYRFLLVTAAHVLDNTHGDTTSIHLRNKINDEYVRLTHPIKIRDNGTNLWTSHPAADVAVMYVSMPSVMDIGPVSVAGIFADDAFIEENDIRPGDQMYALGFPLGSEANSYGFPILRSGAIASYPLLPTSTEKTFLFDFKVYRGNSGGPVFLYAINRLKLGSGPAQTVSFCRIMGLVSQEKIFTEQVQSMYRSQLEQHPLSVAVVVHASVIKETIEILRNSNH